jgi:MoaA/NifB/PqqE/SkfB family radical SAM enzyme
VCPRTAFGDRWVEGDLVDAHWDRLLPDLDRVEHLHLQGWGEPLLYPRLETMAREAHAAGCRVGLTTNGDLLGDAMKWIVNGPVNVVAVSLAGGSEWNRRLRDNPRPDDLFAAVEKLVRERGRGKKPRVHVTYLLVRENAGDLPGTVRAAAWAAVFRPTSCAASRRTQTVVSRRPSKPKWKRRNAPHSSSESTFVCR